MGRRVPIEAVESRVRAHRSAAGLSQQTLAERAGLTRQSVSGIESGHYVPNTAVALRLAAALGCAVEDLFGLSPAPARLQAELVGASPGTGTAARSRVLRATRGPRVLLARVGDRLLARPLTGAASTLAAADGRVLAVPADGSPATVELLVDRRVVEGTVVVLGCDPALALLGAHLARRYPAYRLLWAQAGSLVALRALARGEAHAAGTHLRDPETREFNLPYVRRELAGRHVHVVTLTEWQQGLIVAPGNPRGIHVPADLARPDVTLVNREPGSGSRAMLDEALRAAGIGPGAIRGYARELATHLAVAEAVASGAADVGPGIMAAAIALELDFVPLQQERYDLVIPAEHLESPAVQALLEVAAGLAYRSEVETLGGYDSARAGSLVASITPP